jgi:hypothetical protein
VRAALGAIETEIRSLQDQLQFAAPDEKRRLRDQIALLQRERRASEAVLADAGFRLRPCQVHVLDPSPSRPTARSRPPRPRPGG